MNPTNNEPSFTVDPDDAIVILQLDYYYSPLGRIEIGDGDSGLNSDHRRSSQDVCRLCEISLVEALLLGAGVLPHTPTSSTTHVQSAIRIATANDGSISHVGLSSQFHLTSSDAVRMDGATFGMTSRLDHQQLLFSDIALYDFNLRNKRCGIMLDELNFRPTISPDKGCGEDEAWVWNNMGNKRWLVCRSGIITDIKLAENPDVFARSFLTILSHRLTELEFVLDWKSAVLDEGRIIGLKMEDGVIKSMDALVM